jgi:hypothetical protein
LFNGGKLESFRPSRGIRQGYPISSYLFLIVTEGLLCLLQAHAWAEDINGVKAAPTAPSVNHPLVADDNILFFGANTIEAAFIGAILKKYCDASRQCINKDKSSIFLAKVFQKLGAMGLCTFLRCPMNLSRQNILGSLQMLVDRKMGALNI